MLQEQLFSCFTQHTPCILHNCSVATIHRSHPSPCNAMLLLYNLTLDFSLDKPCFMKHTPCILPSCCVTNKIYFQNLFPHTVYSSQLLCRCHTKVTPVPMQRHAVHAHKQGVAHRLHRNRAHAERFLEPLKQHREDPAPEWNQTVQC